MVLVYMEIAKPIRAQLDDADSIDLFDVHMERVEMRIYVVLPNIFDEIKGLRAGIQEIGFVAVDRLQSYVDVHPVSLTCKITYHGHRVCASCQRRPASILSEG